MKIYFFNICLQWVFQLYREYLQNFIQFCNIHFPHIIIENHYVTIDQKNFINNMIDSIGLDEKIIFCGEIDIIVNIIKDKKRLFYLLNVEQMSHYLYYECLRKLPVRLSILDYSEENIPFFKDIYNESFLLPPYFPLKEKTTKTIDVISLSNNEYRRQILKNVKINNVYFFDQLYGKERDDLYAISKIYVNLHCSNKHKTMEMIRIVNLLCHHVIVLSHKSICNEFLFLHDSIIIFDRIEEIPILIQEILSNYSYYYQKHKINFENYKKYVYMKYKKFIDF